MHKSYFRGIVLAGIVVTLLLAPGCAFDVVSVKQEPASFTAQSGDATSFVLTHEVTAHFGTGFPTKLKANTAWSQAGTTQFGHVFTTRDQIVKVEASNIHEAQIVVNDNRLAGFYLPVEKAFVALSKPIPLETKLNR